jgi:hypothetical protein
MKVRSERLMPEFSVHEGKEETGRSAVRNEMETGWIFIGNRRRFLE